MALASRRLPPTAFLFAAIGRVPFDRAMAEHTRRQRADSYRILFKRSYEQRIDVAEP